MKQTYDCASLPPLSQIIEDVCSDICDNYCKFPEQYAGTPDGQEKLYTDHCDRCPLLRLSV